jgi:aminoglycoside phosphotransferase (APT) family kinase protein
VKLIASGRASEIFDLENGSVLRRFKAGGDPDREALAMRHAASNGYPVPQVLEVLADALVLERIDGPTMVEDVKRRPWRLRPHASLLAELHKRLHEIVAPANLPEASGGDRLLHLDLHPNNVILSPRGAVVLDWTNARRGDPALDVALTWIIAATSGGLLGRIFVRPFLAHFERAELLQALPAAAGWRLADPNVTDGKRVEVRRLVEREAGNLTGD